VLDQEVFTFGPYSLLKLPVLQTVLIIGGKWAHA
jgi:hypothetical protein